MCASPRDCPTHLILQDQSHLSEVYSINTDETRLTGAIAAFVKKPR